MRVGAVGTGDNRIISIRRLWYCFVLIRTRPVACISEILCLKARLPHPSQEDDDDVLKGDGETGLGNRNSILSCRTSPLSEP